MASYANQVAGIHILSHGSSGGITLGNSRLSTETLTGYADRLRDWQAALAPNADILIYGCSVADGPRGVEFVRKLGELTGADIAASNNRPGGTLLGGDWQLEMRTGSVEATMRWTPRRHSGSGTYCPN